MPRLAACTVAALTALVLLSGTIRAQTPGSAAPSGDVPTEPNPWAEPPDLGQLVGRTILATGIVLALAIGTIAVMRYFVKPVRVGSTSDPEQLSLIASLSLPQRATLLLVRARDTDVLVMLDPGGARSMLVLPTQLDGDTGWQPAMAEASAAERPLDEEAKR